MSPQPGNTFIVNSRKFDGTIRRSWQCELIGENSEGVDLLGVFEETVEHPDLGRIEKGTLSRERFYLNRWYNYFVFEHPAGSLRNCYVNICMPPTIGADVIDYVDLDIDLIVWPDGKVVTLDLEEFETNAKAFAYPEKVRRSALRTHSQIQALLLNQTDIHRAIALL